MKITTEVPMSEKVAGKIIATLGNLENPVTCSLDACKALYPDANIDGCDTFEEACRKVIIGSVSYALIPIAYPKINNFLMDINLLIVDQKIRLLPPIVLVSKYENSLTEYNTLYLHPATEPLVSQKNINAKEIIFCSSTVSYTHLTLPTIYSV